MAYVDVGQGDPIVFLHGNPTSSYLWRNIIPYCQDLGRCLAPDLIGMGQSGSNPAGVYGFADHYRYLVAWLEAVGAAENIVFVIHDWGSALGFNWAYRQPQRVQGIAYMEALVRPLAWDEWPEAARGIFQGFRSAKGEELILERNFFIERVLSASVLRKMSEAEMDVYRRPFATPGEARRPMLTWPREIPFEGEPADVYENISNYARWLANYDELPKLFINAEPGMILTGSQREFCRTWPNQTEVTVPGLHFVQEDSPHEIGAAVAAFVRQLRE
jgi:haloalkane dehalogenase